jgi:hypothetical protein
MRAWDNSKPTQLLRGIPEKQIRATEITRYVVDAGYKGIVVFTCGNAAKALRETGIWNDSIVEVGPKGGLQTDRWWTPAEIRRTWPDLFDATSGHLPFTLMVKVAAGLRTVLGALDKDVQYLVPTGSGETILCLGLAYPHISFCAVYDNDRPETTRDAEAPLNAAVDAEFPAQYWHGRLSL